MKTKVSSRQQEIIEVSGKILLEKGIKGLTTKALAAEINFSESAIYRHFPSKEAILELLLNELYFSMSERLHALVNQDLHAITNLELLFDSQFIFFSKNPHFVIAILSEGLIDESPSIQTIMLQLIQMKTSIIRQIIENGKTKNEINITIETDDLIHIIISSFRLQMFKWKLAHFEFNNVEEGNKIMKTVLQLIEIKK
jgi:AcrR family transcriptional regulator